MMNLIIEQLLLLTTGTIALGGDITVPSWVSIVFLFLFIVMLVITINLIVRYKTGKTHLTRELDANEELSIKNKNLEKTYNDTMNENRRLQHQNDELTKGKEELKKLAYFDNLTNLPNNISFKEFLDGVMLTLREDEIVGLFLLNINNFKQINTQLGISYGDELLIDVTHRLKQIISESDYLARIGGDEFAILVQNINESSEYEDKLKRILNVFTYPFPLATDEKFISVSIGVAVAPKDGSNTSTLLKNATVAMRNAKIEKKNSYMYFDESMNKAITRKIQNQSELRKAYEDNEFVLYYEPVISLEDNKIIGFEALIYWNHPTRGLLHPDEFMYYAEETGLIVPIGVWAIKEACKQLKNWQENGYNDIILYYNVSILEFKAPEFVSIIWDIVSKSEIDAKNFTLEITESTALDDTKLTISTIEKLGELGVKFGLDKFGTDYNSIRYLDKLDIVYIKLDKRLSKAAIESIDKKKLVEVIINFKNIFNFDVVAQGIESKEQEMFLKKTHCDMVQGPYYGEPVLYNESIKLLEEGYIYTNDDNNF